MIDAIQIGALILVAIVAIGWIRRRVRRSVAIAVVMSALLFALALPQQAGAAEVRRGQSISVPAGETIHNDLVATGASVRIEGTVEGDVIAFTRDLTVTGHVTGDVIAFSQEALIDGTVDGNVRVFSRGVILQGAVGKNVTAFGSSVDLISKANVGGGMIVLAGEADLDGKIQRDLLGLVGRTRSRWLDRRTGVDTRREPHSRLDRGNSRAGDLPGPRTTRCASGSQVGEPHSNGNHAGDSAEPGGRQRAS